MINGISQKFGQDYKATNTVCNEKNRFFSTDIAAAYPAEAKVKNWVRSYKLDDRKLVVADNYTLNEVLAPNQVNFLTWGNVTFPSPGKVRIEVRGQKVELDYPVQFKAELETFGYLASPVCSQAMVVAPSASLFMINHSPAVALLALVTLVFKTLRVHNITSRLRMLINGLK